MDVKSNGRALNVILLGFFFTLWAVFVACLSVIRKDMIIAAAMFAVFGCLYFAGGFIQLKGSPYRLASWLRSNF